MKKIPRTAKLDEAYRLIQQASSSSGEVQKKYSRKGKLNEKKIHARQLTLKNIHATAGKKFIQGIW